MRKHSTVNFTNFSWLVTESPAVIPRHELDYMKNKKIQNKSHALVLNYII